MKARACQDGAMMRHGTSWVMQWCVLIESDPYVCVCVFAGGLRGATIIDSLDTLYIMGLMEEYEEAKRWVENDLDLNSVTSAFSPHALLCSAPRRLSFSSFKSSLSLHALTSLPLNLSSDLLPTLHLLCPPQSVCLTPQSV